MIVLAGLALTACQAPAPSDRETRQLLAAQCGSCHIIPGIKTAQGRVGPSLVKVGERAFLAGKIPNSSENFERFLVHPQQMSPGGAMPELGISPRQAQAIRRTLWKK